MAEFKLNSGNVLKIGLVPFAEARALYQALLEEAKDIKFSTQDEFGNVFKDLFCVGFSSKKVEACLWECFKRCQYCDKRGELKIDKDTFEPDEARVDYIEVCILVTKEVTSPFLSGLFAEYKALFKILPTTLQ
jgi:hypothetical protein